MPGHFIADAGEFVLQVAGRSVLPGAAYFEGGAAAVRTLKSSGPGPENDAALTALTIPAPLPLPQSSEHAAMLCISLALPSGTMSATTNSSTRHNHPQVHVQAQSAILLQPVTSWYQPEFPRPISFLKSTARPKANPVPAQASVSNSAAQGGAPGFWLHPAALDASLQLGQVFVAMIDDKPRLYVPAALEAFCATRLGKEALFSAAAVPHSGSAATPVSSFNLKELQGSTLCSISGEDCRSCAGPLTPNVCCCICGH